MKKTCAFLLDLYFDRVVKMIKTEFQADINKLSLQILRDRNLFQVYIRFLCKLCLKIVVKKYES